MAINPLKLSKAIEEKYLSYLETLFNIRNPDLEKDFSKLLREESSLLKGPYIETIPPFENACSIEELIQKEVLSDKFYILNNNYPLNRKLYHHQQLAIEKIILHKRNVVIATGTGSGKTEAFLIPILDSLLKEGASPQAGVRALLLYPMNALANDQLKRLRQWLRGTEITFGRYTGETKETYKEARDQYESIYKENHLENELISREQMRRSPPHILITNYAMLEYLLLRPEDIVFFEGEYAQHWRYIVLDEAHTYNGAKGIEIAMLLRRLKDRVVDGQRGRWQCIATSATLSSEPKDSSKVAIFAENLFDEKFESQDVITARRCRLMPQDEVSFMPQTDIYRYWQKQMELCGENVLWEDIIRASIEKDVPKEILSNAVEKVRSSKKCWQVFLYDVLAKDEYVRELIRMLEQGPKDLKETAKQLFGENEDALYNLISLIELSLHAKEYDESNPLIPAKYHFFSRAVEGIFISLFPQPKLYLERYEKILENEKEVSVFEVGVCRNCGAIFLIGKEQDKKFIQLSGTIQETKNKMIVFYLPDLSAPLVTDNSIDEDDVVELEQAEEKNIDLKFSHEICLICGAIDEINHTSPLCECGQEYYKKVVKVDIKEGKLHSCPSCHKTSSSDLLSRFITGNEAVNSVLGNALYQDSISDQNGDKRQLLIFSDSRQDAAYFAPYFQRTYEKILRRRLILKVLEENQEKVLENKWGVKDLVKTLKKLINEREDFNNFSLQEKENEAWKWVINDLCALDPRISLEGLGLLSYMLVMPSGWAPPPFVIEQGFSEKEVIYIYQVLLTHFRKHRAIVYPDNISIDDLGFPNKSDSYFTYKRGSNSSYIFGWLPKSGTSNNSRLDYLVRLLKSIGVGKEEVAWNLLEDIWKKDLFRKDSPWEDYFQEKQKSPDQKKMVLDYWELKPTLVDDTIKWYKCDRCGNITLFNVRDVCPTYRCSGKLFPCKPQDIFKNNHYYKLYTQGDPLRLEVKEHTAQLTSQYAAQLQEDFIKGKVNALSCSTTFELGVDIGELETVFLRNVPPSPANYIQRAGRAGRRINSAAFVLTYAPLRPHDLYYYIVPHELISGKIKAPTFKIANEKIVRRHCYASAIASFWRKYPNRYGTVEKFFFDCDVNVIDEIAEYLNQKPSSLKTTLLNIVPKELRNVLDIEGWGWVKGLLSAVDKEEGVLFLADKMVKEDVKQLEEFRKQCFEQNKKSDYIKTIINTIKSEQVINYLSRRNVLPKYGFPVDVVDLEIRSNDKIATQVELNRDLRIAISEFAPESQVVAAGKLLTSRYIKRYPDRSWLKYQYMVCPNCGAYQSLLVANDNEQQINECKICQTHWNNARKKGKFIIPQFGFIAENKFKEPGDSKPERTYTSRTYFSGLVNQHEPLSIPIGGIKIKITAGTNEKLAVINDAGGKQFWICETCGYGEISDKKIHNHKDAMENECGGTLRSLSLGHEFLTDVIQVCFDDVASEDNKFWYSLLYALLNGISIALDIERNDIDGVLYPLKINNKQVQSYSLIFFDNVPGGAGHVKRLTENDGTVIEILNHTLSLLKKCTCGGEEGDTSCYGCLRSYRNQFCHDLLKRRPVIDFLSKLIS